jgi:hypothetical protein
MTCSRDMPFFCLSSGHIEKPGDISIPPLVKRFSVNEERKSDERESEDVEGGAEIGVVRFDGA